VRPLKPPPNADLGAGWKLTLLVDAEPGPLPAQVETLETKTANRLSLPTYCEAPLDLIQDAYAKVRTNVPDPESLAHFLISAAQRRLPFKATAGLHQAIRAQSHGFLNVFAGATFAWFGMDQATLVRLLNDTDSQSFQFGNEGLHWRDCFASTDQIQQARRDFAHSFGSCSFQEPVDDLRALNLLP
jgi:hypothetical protein